MRRIDHVAEFACRFRRRENARVQLAVAGGGDDEKGAVHLRGVKGRAEVFDAPGITPVLENGGEFARDHAQARPGTQQVFGLARGDVASADQQHRAAVQVGKDGVMSAHDGSCVMDARMIGALRSFVKGGFVLPLCLFGMSAAITVNRFTVQQT